MLRKRHGVGHRRPPPPRSFRRRPLNRTGEPPAIREWRQWTRHQYNPGYWVGTRIPPFLLGSRDSGRSFSWGVRWFLAVPLLALISQSWLLLVAGLLAAPDGRQPVPGPQTALNTPDFHVVLPCWIPDGIVEVPRVGLSRSDQHAVLLSYPPHRPSSALGGLVPSRVGLYIKERRDQFGLGNLSLPQGDRQRLDDTDVVVTPTSDEESLQTVSWVRDGVVFEMGSAGIPTEDLLAVVRSTFQSCSWVMVDRRPELLG